jgi:hypothetical protein
MGVFLDRIYGIYRIMRATFLWMRTTGGRRRALGAGSGVT